MWVVGRFTQRDGTVMATDTGALNFGMIHPYNGRPGVRNVAGLTKVGAGNVVARLSGGG